MKRPSFQMYQGDWLSNQKLRRCSFALRGVWIDALCLMADSDEYGVMRCPLHEVANAVGCQLKMLKELREKGVLKGADVGEQLEAFVFTPRHAGKAGEPVTLIPAQPGPIWYSSRMVRDEYVRTIRGTNGGINGSPKGTSGVHLPYAGEHAGARSSSTSSSATSTTSAEASAEARGGTADQIPDCPHEKLKALFHEVLPMLPQVLEWEADRQAIMRARWRQKAMPKGDYRGYQTEEAGLRYWRRYFEHVKKSKFLTGNTEGSAGRQPFVATMEWLIRPKNFQKVVEGNYHRDVMETAGG